ncbi:uncharacterized protein K460DRAFT_23438 [Cucurbitaria berberidis CBS 394.84]|uniref:Uncharacterized protein n=1 Tax=Cucurbitaria berberidis CBS 394.84 TaxID=1168544 RepID=A0A9P4GT59_9PLEO|nr:uncharacterized protein K460DRAFT_23438 [Cucurbitaria berberidis CBS 394.84]KAF1850885.1 hypothetical protein K460DRAFT_23438 [Cucurbitaria berberidis CBS 394.84]
MDVDIALRRRRGLNPQAEHFCLQTTALNTFEASPRPANSRLRTLDRRQPAARLLGSVHAVGAITACLYLHDSPPMNPLEYFTAARILGGCNSSITVPRRRADWTCKGH